MKVELERARPGPRAVPRGGETTGQLHFKLARVRLARAVHVAAGQWAGRTIHNGPQSTERMGRLGASVLLGGTSACSADSALRLELDDGGLTGHSQAECLFSHSG